MNGQFSIVKCSIIVTAIHKNVRSGQYIKMFTKCYSTTYNCIDQFSIGKCSLNVTTIYRK